MAPAFCRDDENRPQRWILASSGVDGTAVPGSLSEGAAEAKLRLRECSSLVAPGRWFTRWLLLALKFLSVYVHRGTLPQSALAGCQLPQGGSRGRLRGVRTIQRGTCETARFRAIFIAPTEGGCHSSCRSETARLRAIFIAPTKGVCRSLGGAA